MTSFSPNSGLCVLEHGDDRPPAEYGLLCRNDRDILDRNVRDIREYLPDFALRMHPEFQRPDIGKLHRNIAPHPPAPMNLELLSALDRRVGMPMEDGDVQGVVGVVLEWWDYMCEAKPLSEVVALDPVPRMINVLPRMINLHGWICALPCIDAYFFEMAKVSAYVRGVVGAQLTVQEKARTVVKKAMGQ